MWFLFGYCSVCQQTSPSAKKMKLISFSLFSLWNHSLIIVCINTVWAKADSPNSRSYTVFTGKATYHHPGSVRSLKYVQPNVKIQFTLLCVCSPVSTYFFIPAKLKPHTALERAILGEACFTFYAKKTTKKNLFECGTCTFLPCWLWQGGFNEFPANSVRLRAWKNPHRQRAFREEARSPATTTTRHRGCSHSWWGKCFFVSHPWNIVQRAPSETRFNKLRFLSSPLTYLRVN